MPLSYKLNEINVRKFLEACNEPFINPETNKEEKLDTREIAKKIIKATIHISYEEFIKELIKNIKHLISLLKPNRPLFINIDIKRYRDKSNYWIYLYVIDYIKYKYKDIEIILIPTNKISNEKLENDDIILLIDDCIYSGQQMSESIFNLKVENDKKFTFFILCSFMTRKGTERIIEAVLKNKLLKLSKIIFNKYITTPPNTNNILSSNEIILLNDIYTKMYGSFNNKYLIYFDHKLADIVSTITAFYSGIVPNAKNRYYLKKENKKLLTIIPLFTNCENIRNTNMWKPECPSTPYKKDINNKFMKVYKKLVKNKAKSLSLSISKRKVEKQNNSI